MSRVINLTLSQDAVADKCATSGVSISAIEPLPGGGTHLVCVTGEGARQMRVVFEADIIIGPVKRFPFYRT
jgi:hypothetical protein